MEDLDLETKNLYLEMKNFNLSSELVAAVRQVEEAVHQVENFSLMENFSQMVDLEHLRQMVEASRKIVVPVRLMVDVRRNIVVPVRLHIIDQVSPLSYLLIFG